jgi:phosphate transport system substrate-binding protein
LKAALEAVNYGVPVRILLIDEVEPGKPAVQSGQYTLKRPIIFLTHKEPTFVTRAFISFALSPAGQHILDEMYIPLAYEPSSPAALPNR